MHAVEIIEKKKRGEALSEAEIAFFIDGYTRGTIPDYQASALAMAICFRSMNEREITALTQCMARSGDMLDLTELGACTADKHSTGGVGDKTTLLVAPIVASLGACVCKMSGRGLGFTGGTVDKLQAIPGYRTELPKEEFLTQAKRIGIAVVGQTGNFTPADKKLYALRDVTATVDSIPLITSSVMSKKLAAGSRTIVLDVKVGRGAFMKSVEEAEILADFMVEIGKRSGRRTVALLTNMDVPLGYAVGNSLEVAEAVELLCGKVRGPASADLLSLCVALASHMVSCAVGIPLDRAEADCRRVIEDGTAYRKMRAWVEAQGGDLSCFERGEVPLSPCCTQILSPCDGYIARIDAQQIGLCAASLGAGRLTKEDSVDLGAGIMLCVTVGDYVKRGEPLCRLYSQKERDITKARALCESAFAFFETPCTRPTLIYQTVYGK